MAGNAFAGYGKAAMGAVSSRSSPPRSNRADALDRAESITVALDQPRKRTMAHQHHRSVRGYRPAWIGTFVQRGFPLDPSRLPAARELDRQGSVDARNTKVASPDRLI